MKFNVNVKQGVEVKLVFEDKTTCPCLKALVESKVFEGKLGQIYIRLLEDKSFKIYLGLGKEKDLTLKDLRVTFYQLANEVSKLNINEISFEVLKFNGLCSYKTAFNIAEGMLCSEYEFNKFKSEKTSKAELTVNYNVNPEKQQKVEEGILDATHVVEGMFLTRDLINQPANVIYPETLAKIALEELEKENVKVTVYDLKDIEALHMHAFLNVARASAKEPRLIVMEYMNNSDSLEKVGLIGKGVTYDCGGLAIKPAASMVTMFDDMGGSATVIGTIKALAKAKAKCNVVGVVAACENMINGDAYRNGDIIQSMSGKTIEIINTDAEGRLTLADAIYYATNNLQCSKVIDIATLTGACLSALGEQVSGVVTNNKEFYQQLEEASVQAQEYIHLFPNLPYYEKMNHSEVADIKNAGGKYGGAITAGLFVGSFLAKEMPWLHIDIAGTAYISTPYDCNKKGATGSMVKTLFHLLNK